MTNNYVYEFGDSLYLNITNRCPNNCEFCIRNIKDGVSGSDLWLLKEPTFEELVDDISMYDLSKYKEIVFCGFGEPMCNLSMISQIAPYIDSVSVSLNASTPEVYQEICRSKYGEAAFDAMLKFTKDCVNAGIDTTMSVVDFIGEDEVRACGELAKSVGAHFKVRETIREDTEY